MKLEDFINTYKPFNVTVNYNDYKINYESVSDYIEIEDLEDNVLDKEECISTGTIYELIVYPDNAIGSYRIYSSRLDLAIQEMNNIMEKEIIRRQR